MKIPFYKHFAGKPLLQNQKNIKQQNMDLQAEFGFQVASLSLLFYVDSVISSWISHSLKAGRRHMVGATEYRIKINWHETTFLIFLSFYSNPNYSINFARVDS